MVAGLCGDDGASLESAWNFGPDASGEVTVLEIAEAVARSWGDGARVEIQATPVEFAESSVLRLDSSKARKLLGWRPAWGLDKGLQMTLDWYRAWHRGDDVRATTLAQIDAHLAWGSA